MIANRREIKTTDVTKLDSIFLKASQRWKQARNKEKKKPTKKKETRRENTVRQWNGLRKVDHTQQLYIHILTDTNRPYTKKRINRSIEWNGIA